MVSILLPLFVSDILKNNMYRGGVIFKVTENKSSGGWLKFEIRAFKEINGDQEKRSRLVYSSVCINYY